MLEEHTYQVKKSPNGFDFLFGDAFCMRKPPSTLAAIPPMCIKQTEQRGRGLRQAGQA